MRTLLVGALCATLIGCSSPPRGMVERCTSQACFSRTAATTPIELQSEPHLGPLLQKRRRSLKKRWRSLKRLRRRQNQRLSHEITTALWKKKQSLGSWNPTCRRLRNSRLHPIVCWIRQRPQSVGKQRFPEPHQPPEPPDPVLEKAKFTVAAKMENPASAEFVEMKRAMRKTTFGRPFEIICGHVKGKKTSGEGTGERPFLYLVKEDEAFIVGANPDSVAAIAYRSHCNSGR